ncbi:sugar phosphate isomerase/epimerase family protein [Ruixingdingia sedimenti]|uniref:TIM barrel protein n=1 Tax=Ruixingdingia sedimenti TaxID=3073604 RepID=A0ABU1F3T7_9RHOB|nr:TIM barrel protein [Xinfangfangia sp. LG-4]MDR5651494.1 TIM barrel protein [Xinfangfangia sp. LG-4]
MRPISLEFLTASEVPSARMIELAAEHGCSHVGLLVQPMRPFPFFDLLGDTRARRETRNALAANGIKLDVTDAFNIQPETDPEIFRPAMESSAYLGADWINVLARDPDESRLMDSFGDTCRIAREYGLKVSTEISRRFAHDTLTNTVRFLKELGDPEARITLDSMHFFRHVGTMAEMRAHLDWICRVQLCDGAGDIPPEQQLHEARSARLPPGDGIFPLQDFVDVLPPGMVIGVEIPNIHMTLEDRLTRSLAQTRAMIEKADRKAGRN